MHMHLHLGSCPSFYGRARKNHVLNRTPLTITSAQSPMYLTGTHLLQHIPCTTFHVPHRHTFTSAHSPMYLTDTHAHAHAHALALAPGMLIMLVVWKLHSLTRARAPPPPHTHIHTHTMSIELHWQFLNTHLKNTHVPEYYSGSGPLPAYFLFILYSCCLR